MNYFVRLCDCYAPTFYNKHFVVHINTLYEYNYVWNSFTLFKYNLNDFSIDQYSWILLCGPKWMKNTLQSVLYRKHDLVQFKMYVNFIVYEKV